MAKKNKYIAQRDADREGFFIAGCDTATQQMFDMMCLALHDPNVMGKDTFGKKRLEKVYENLKALADKYHICFTADKEADYYQEQLDALIHRGCDEFYPFYERYPQLKQFKYDKARKGWK